MFFLTVGSLSVFSFCDFGCFVGFVLWFRWVWFDLWFGGLLGFCCDFILARFWQWCMVGVDELEKLRPWRFRRRVDLWFSGLLHFQCFHFVILVVLWVLCFDFGGCDLICDLEGFWDFILWVDFDWVLAVVHGWSW